MTGLTGATGEIGGRLARRLADRGERQRLIVRDRSRLPPVAGADVVEVAGYHDGVGMRDAFGGLDTLFLCSAREAADRVEQHKTAVDAAVAAGIERIVYLSSVGAAADATFTFARHHFLTEQHIRASGLAFTFSRQNLYMDLLPLIPGPDSVIRGPGADGRVVPVLRDDVADALLTLVTQAGHEGATYELSGPDALTLGDVAGELSRALGRAVTYENETLEQAQASRAGYGAPDWELEGWITTYTAIAAGEFDVLTDDVMRLTGHPPVSVPELLSTL